MLAIVSILLALFAANITLKEISMAATKQILTSIHGKRLGLAQNGDLVVNGRTVATYDDTGAQKVISQAAATQNATGTLTAAQLLNGVITSTTAAAVAGTVPTGTLLDAAAGLNVDEAFDWSVVVTGANTFTVTAGTGHTLVGNPAVATATSGRFRSRKTAANTFVTTRTS